MRKQPKDPKPCWEIELRQTLQRTATVEVRAWTQEEAVQMAVRGDVRPAIDWTEGTWSRSDIVREDDGDYAVRKVACE